MARVFTITPGLENMGGLKTGGQGSIYKGRRIGEIITAIKILPTPIFSETSDDKNWLAFTNEVEKLKKVNEVPNPNVVKILSSGISEAGNFPYIEMEFIEGPDLEELLRAPNSGVFTINETLKVAEQLANAIAHCHLLGVRHGDIKSNNVKYNINTGNYVLIDFGLAVIPDEKRITSIRQSGTVEFMAPELYSGQMLPESDVYSFGIVLFELLTGSVPFPLNSRGETARNEVRLAHMATPVPDLIERRKLAIPPTWNNQKISQELQVPKWLINLINKCLDKKPENRFSNGNDLKAYINQQLMPATASGPVRLKNISLRPMLKEDLVSQQEQLRKQLTKYKQDLLQKEAELTRLMELLQEKKVLPKQTDLVQQPSISTKQGRVSKPAFFVLMLFTLAFGAFAMYPIVKSLFASQQTVGISGKTALHSSGKTKKSRTDETKSEADTTGKSYLKKVTLNSRDTLPGRPDEGLATETGATTEKALENEPLEEETKSSEGIQKSNSPGDENANTETRNEKFVDQSTDAIKPGENGIAKKYLVVSKAYFYNEPDENARRNEFISPLEKAVVQALNDRYGFIYVVITNPQGQIFKGWLRKSELKLYSID